jgi:hypothetical protein
MHVSAFLFKKHRKFVEMDARLAKYLLGAVTAPRMPSLFRDGISGRTNTYSRLERFKSLDHLRCDSRSIESTA